MPNVRITDLDLIPFSAITSDDVFPIVDIDADTTYKIDISGLTKYISSQNNKWYIQSGETITVGSYSQKFIYGDLLVEGTLFLEENSLLYVINGNIELINGGTIIGNGLHYIIDIPVFDTFVTGGTYNYYSGVTTFVNNSGNIFTVSGFTIANYKTIPSGVTITVPENTQKFIYGDLLVEGTIFLEDNSDLFVLNGNITLENGGQIIGSGLTHIVEIANTDTYVTGGTNNIYSGITTFVNNNGDSFKVDGYTVPNFKYIPSGITVTVPTNTQKLIYGDIIVEGVLNLEGDSELFILNGDLYTSGGTVSGTGITYLVDLPEIDTFVTGGTYNIYSGTTEYVNNFNDVFSVTGLPISNFTYIPSNVVITVPSYTQKFVYGDIIVDGEIILKQYSELFILNGDLILTGGTVTQEPNTIVYSVSLPEFDTKVSAFTYSNNTFTIYDNSGNTFNAEINTMTGLTVNGVLSATTIQAQNIDLCATNGTLYTDQISGCSPINILSETYFQQGLSAITISGDTFYGNGSNLIGVVGDFTGGTISGETLFEGGLSGTTISGDTFYGDGSNLTNINNYITTAITLTSSDILSLGTPFELLPAPGVNNYYIVDRVVMEYSYGTSAYVIPTSPTIYLDGCFDSYIDKTLLTTASNSVCVISGNLRNTYQIGVGSGTTFIKTNRDVLNSNLLIGTPNGDNPTSGDGTIKIKITYKVETFGA